MLLFLLLLFPLSLVAYWIYKKDSKQIVAIVTGLLIGAVVCAFSFFFKFSHRVVPYSFGLNFLYYFQKLGLIPAAVIYGLFFLISKDAFEDRIDYFDSLLLACYAIMVPFSVLTGNDSSVYSGYSLFVKPVIYLSMIFITGSVLKQFYGSVANKKPTVAVVTGIIGVLVLLIPSVIEALYAINVSFWIVLVISLIYSVLPLGILFIKNKK